MLWKIHLQYFKSVMSKNGANLSFLFSKKQLDLILTKKKTTQMKKVKKISC